MVTRTGSACGQPERVRGGSCTPTGSPVSLGFAGRPTPLASPSRKEYGPPAVLAGREGGTCDEGLELHLHSGVDRVRIALEVADGLTVAIDVFDAEVDKTHRGPDQVGV